MNRAILKYNVIKEDSGKTVEFICRKRLGMSAGVLTETKLAGGLLLSGKPCITTDKVSENDILSADVTELIATSSVEPIYAEVEILYDDAYYTIANKPRKMSVHQSQGNYGNTLSNAIAYYWKTKGEAHKIHPVNRLDKDTSGICIIAKNRFAHSAIDSNIITKEYMAIVHNVPNVKKGSVTTPIKRAEGSTIKRICAPDGKPAVTNYEVIRENDKYSLLRIKLDTGRTHQIRVHMSSIGHPLVGDWLYGSGDDERHIASGHLLHAYKISFIHPVTKEPLTFEVPLPPDMQTLCNN